MVFLLDSKNLILVARRINPFDLLLDLLLDLVLPVFTVIVIVIVVIKLKNNKRNNLNYNYREKKNLYETVIRNYDHVLILESLQILIIHIE